MNRDERRQRRRVRKMETKQSRNASRRLGRDFHGHYTQRLWVASTPAHCFVIRSFPEAKQLRSEVPESMTLVEVEDLLLGTHTCKEHPGVDELCLHIFRSEEITTYEQDDDRGSMVEDYEILHAPASVPVTVLPNAKNTRISLADCPCLS